MDLTTNELYKHIKRKAKNNLNKNIKPELPSILIKTRPIEIPDTKKEESESEGSGNERIKGKRASLKKTR